VLCSNYLTTDASTTILFIADFKSCNPITFYPLISLIAIGYGVRNVVLLPRPHCANERTRSAWFVGVASLYLRWRLEIMGFSGNCWRFNYFALFIIIMHYYYVLNNTYYYLTFWLSNDCEILSAILCLIY